MTKKIKTFVFLSTPTLFIRIPVLYVASKTLAPLKNQIRRVITNTLMWRRHIFLIYDSNFRKRKICNRKSSFYGSTFISIGIISVKNAHRKLFVGEIWHKISLF